MLVYCQLMFETPKLVDDRCQLQEIVPKVKFARAIEFSFPRILQQQKVATLRRLRRDVRFLLK